MIEAGAAGGDQFDSKADQFPDDRSVESVVDKDTDAIVAFGQGHSVEIEMRLKVVEGVAFAYVVGIEGSLVEIVGAEECNFHRTSAKPFLRCLKMSPPARNAAEAQRASNANSCQSGMRWVSIRSR